MCLFQWHARKTHTYIHRYIHVYIYIYIYVNKFVFVPVARKEDSYIHTCIHTHTHMYTYLSSGSHTSISTHSMKFAFVPEGRDDDSYIHTWTHAYSCIYVHIYNTCIHTYLSSGSRTSISTHSMKFAFVPEGREDDLVVQAVLGSSQQTSI